MEISQERIIITPRSPTKYISAEVALRDTLNWFERRHAYDNISQFSFDEIKAVISYKIAHPTCDLISCDFWNDTQQINQLKELEK